MNSLSSCSKCLRKPKTFRSRWQWPTRTLSTTSGLRDVEERPSASPESSQPTSLPPSAFTALSSEPLDRYKVYTRSQERRLLRDQGKYPIGSRRRRVAMNTLSNIPFELMPYQCFQEARKVIATDRLEKVSQIETQRGRISRLMQQDSAVSGGERQRENRLRSMHKQLEKLKILADINDPIVKKNFEDGLGDMNKPIYRHLADKKWRSYNRPIVVQRVEQMHVIPDVLPNIDPLASVELAFGRSKVQPGVVVDSLTSERAPTLSIQVFDAGVRLVTIVVVDSDVPNVDTDGFDHRCHGLYSNIEISPTTGAKIPLGELEENQTILPWMPPFSQKGSPYHRLSIWVLHQRESRQIDAVAAREFVKRDGFKLRGYVSKHQLKPVGVTMFRSLWDHHTAEVMNRAGVPGANIEFKRKKVVSRIRQ